MAQMEVHHVWFPTHGRMLRRIRKRGTNGQIFHGQLFSINPFRAGLVYQTEESATTKAAPALGEGGVALNPGTGGAQPLQDQKDQMRRTSAAG